MSANSRDGSRATFIEGMSALGWKMGAQYVLEERWADGHADRLPGLAQELAAKKPAVIVAIPKLQRVGFLADPTSRSYDGSVTDARRAAERLRVQAVVADMARPLDIEPAMARLAKDKLQALVMLPSAWLYSHQPKIIGLALAQRWPVVGTDPVTARLGGLFSYGPNRAALIRRSAYYVDRILKGAKPGDLPIELPTAFELILNLKTAKTLGITIPPSMRLRATEVIE